MAVLNLWARFLYEPLTQDRVRRIQETDDPQFGREVAERVHAGLKRTGGVKPPREFVLMDRSAIGLGGVFVRLKAELNWSKLFHGLIADFDEAALAKRQAAALVQAGYRRLVDDGPPGGRVNEARPGGFAPGPHQRALPSGLPAKGGAPRLRRGRLLEPFTWSGWTGGGHALRCPCQTGHRRSGTDTAAHGPLPSNHSKRMDCKGCAFAGGPGGKAPGRVQGKALALLRSPDCPGGPS